MRSICILSTLLVALVIGLVCVEPVESNPASTEEPKPPPYGIERRIPWTTSRVVGSPEPPPPYRVRRVYPKLELPFPMGVANIPGTDHLLLIHQMSAWGGVGRIVLIKDDPNVTRVEDFLKVDGIAYGVAFHPNYDKNGYLYVGDNGPFKDKPKYTRVTRYTVSRKPPYKILPGSKKLIIQWESDGHNGGDLAFGKDGMLYISSGDGTSDSDTNLTGQDMTKLLAKVLRIDVDHPDPGKTYSVPRDNPFLQLKDARPETWAYGFRNPWRLHIDHKTGDLWVGNNGQDLWEQIFLVECGANYGWSVMEGSHPFYLNRKAGPTPFSKPIAEHHHSEARSMTGGIVYHGSKLPELQGAYIYGDFSTGKIWGIRHKQGKVTWHQELTDSILQITGFGTDSKGELLIADHGGGYYQLEPTPRDVPRPRFPTKLSETGLFASVKDHQPQPALIPYTVNASLWSDGAHKDRFIALPGVSQIDITLNRGWNCPDGTVLVKTFSLDMESGNSASRRRIETRLLTRQEGEWVGYSYLWNDEQTDAVLVASAGVDKTYSIKDGNAPGGQRRQTWHYPSRTECMVCHSRAANWVLGLTTLQMNKDHDYGGVTDNQLRTLAHLGVFRINVAEHINEFKQNTRQFRTAFDRALQIPFDVLDPLLPEAPPLARNLLKDARQIVSKPLERVEKQAVKHQKWLETLLRQKTRYTTLLPKAPAEYGRLVDPYNPRENLNSRARSYLHSNCSQCHVAAGGGNAMMELEFTTKPEKVNIVGAIPQHHTFGIANAKLVDPGHPGRSLLYLRMARRGEGQMPPLATSLVDEEAVKMLHDWIKQLRPERPTSGDEK